MLNEAVVDLVGGASDARADRRSDMGAARAEAFHRVQRRIGDPGERALPARVRGADDAGLAVGEKHGHAVGGQYAEQDAGRARDERIGFGPRGEVCGLVVDDAALSVNLIKPGKRDRTSGWEGKRGSDLV